MRRRLRWGMGPPPPASPHQRRDTVIVYGSLSVIILILGIALGRSFFHTVVLAVFFFVVTVLWAFYRLRSRPPK